MTPRSVPHLVLIDPSGARRRVSLDFTPFRIGRQQESHLCLLDPQNRISRRHAVILREGNRCLIRDDRSRHGTYVNGRRLEQPHVLRNNDRIDFGIPDSYCLIFVSEEEALRQLLERVETPLSDTTPRELRNLNLLLEVGRALQAGLAREDVLAAVVDACLKITGTERGFLFLRDSAGSPQLAVGRDRARRSLDAAAFRGSRSIIEDVLAGSEDIIVTDKAAEEEVRDRTSVIDLNLCSVICLSLRQPPAGASLESTAHVGSRPAPLGVIYLDSRRAGRPVTSSDREILQELAREAARVVENTRLFDAACAKERIDRELAVAREIQQALLFRQARTYETFEVAGVNLPSHHVSGDYYDVIDIGDGRFAVVMADVSGKGISAALLSANLSGAVVAMLQLRQPVEAVAAQLNDYLCRHAGVNKFATCFLAVLEPGGRLDYVNAGHFPPLLLAGESDVRVLPAGNIPLGFLGQEQYRAETLALRPSDMLVLYTDGLVEAVEPGGQLYGLPRFRELVARFRRQPAANVAEGVMAEIRRFSGRMLPDDDMTLLVLRYAGKA